MSKRVFPTLGALCESLGEYILRIARESVDKHHEFRVAVSGGSLPSQLKQALVDNAEIFKNMPWSQWKVYLVDERVVPLDHADSNYKAFVDTVAKAANIPESNLFPIRPELSPADAAADYLQQLEKTFGPQLPRFDLILLGMGPDGHTASLFPDHPLLLETAWVASIADSPKPPPQRITLTLPVLNNASYTAFVTTGKSKQDAIVSVLEKKQLPASLVQPTDGELVWFLDQDAAGLLATN
eukprot:TRINITY_DN1037_c0_g4_i1.p1 TRINITY_DN1037_c0_g4~~TRINITY_DN1037_c0_g4_i1.p1  ORF type:complete len:240 (+),score=60.40 TRINITY_DN1037_c0_g4_i1:50-769(+)